MESLEKYFETHPEKVVETINDIDVPKQERFNQEYQENVTTESKRALIQRVFENINVYKYMLNKEPVKIDSFFN